MARVVLNVMGTDGENKLLEAGNIEPFPSAFSDENIQKQYRKAEKYSLTDSFPRISEEQATEIARQKIGYNFSYQGLTDLFIFIPSLDLPYQIGVPFSPYYEFIIEENEKKIWVNSEDGSVIDQAHLKSEIDEFEKMIEEGKLNPLPSAEKDEENND